MKRDQVGYPVAFGRPDPHVIVFTAPFEKARFPPMPALTPPSSLPLRIIGGGLAGCEAAWQAARQGVPVILSEMRPERLTPAHRSGLLAELVCSNSFRSDDPAGNAVGLLHAEMRLAGSLILQAADATRVPAGGALAVDREGFAKAVTQAMEDHPLIDLRREEVTHIPDDGPVIIASGPLTDGALAQAIRARTGEDALAFFDALAPIVHKDSLDFSKVWFQSRYDKGDGKDYLNCALSQDEYAAFIDALIEADTVPLREWEGTPYFDGCLPVEEMAARGRETLAHGPMKPVGLTNPNDPDSRPHAVVQLRQDNALGTLYNMVGFQTRLRHGDQIRVFRMIPGLENAEFARLGGMHRNTFLNSPRLLDDRLRLKSAPLIRFAGQITGCEGYVESAAIGFLAGRFAADDLLDLTRPPPPETTALGALLTHVTRGADATTYQPMNINFGLLPPLPAPEPPVGGRKPRPLKGRDKKAAQSARALEDIARWLSEAA